MLLICRSILSNAVKIKPQFALHHAGSKRRLYWARAGGIRAKSRRAGRCAAMERGTRDRETLEEWGNKRRGAEESKPCQDDPDRRENDRSGGGGVGH